MMAYIRKIFLLALVGLLAAACGGGGGGGNSPVDKPPAQDEIKPLSENTFLFMRKIDSTIDHLYIYDLDSREERQVTDFDNGSVSRYDYSLSPDRRWVVFRAIAFRPDEEDAQAILQENLWKVSVDGKQFVRLTHPIMPMDESCPASKPGCERQRSDPIFSRDGSTIYYSLSDLWDAHSTFCTSNADCGGLADCVNHFCRGSQLEGSAYLSRISSDGQGIDDPIPPLDDCTATTNPAFSHSGEKLLYQGIRCIAGNNGIYLKQKPFDQGNVDFIMDNDSFNSAVWSKDDTGFFYVESEFFDDDQDGKSETYGDSLFLYEIESGESRMLLRPPAGAGVDSKYSIWGFSLNADQSKIVLSIEYPQNTVNLFLFDLSTNDLEQLTTTNDAYNPVWFP